MYRPCEESSSGSYRFIAVYGVALAVSMLEDLDRHA